MRIVFSLMFTLLLSACSIDPFKGTYIGDGKYKAITGAESRSEAFIVLISLMRSTCGYDGVLYEIVAQEIEGNGEVISRVSHLDEYSYGRADTFNKTQTLIDNEVSKGYDIITVFKCTGRNK